MAFISKKLFRIEEKVFETVLSELQPVRENTSTIHLTPGKLVNLEEIEKSRISDSGVLSDTIDILWEDASEFSECKVK